MREGSSGERLPAGDERRIGGEDAGAGQVAACRRDRRRDDVGGDALGGQAGRHHVVGDGPEVDPHAPRRDGDELRGHEVGEHQERRRRWRLLDGLQQSSCRLRGEQVEVVEHDHLAGALDRRPRGQLDDLAGLVGGDGRSGSLDLVDVRVLGAQRQADGSDSGVVDTGERAGRRRPGRPGAWSSRTARAAGRRAPAPPPPPSGWRSPSAARRRRPRRWSCRRPLVVRRRAPAWPPWRRRRRRRRRSSGRGRRRPSHGSRRRRGRGSRHRPARSGRGRGCGCGPRARPSATSSRITRSGHRPSMAQSLIWRSSARSRPRPYPW